MSNVPTVTVGPSLSPVGGNFRVNPTAAGVQRPASAAPLAGGGFVATWVSNPTGDAGSDRVFAQVYGPEGNAVGAEFAVAAGDIARQGSPTVAQLADGGFAIGWSLLVQGSDHRVFAQRYDPAGQAVGSAITVATLGTGAFAPTAVDLTARPGGGFLATWSNFDGTNSGEVMARLYDATGGALGAAFRVNTFTAGAQDKSDAAVFADGSFVVVWGSFGQDGSGGGVYAQRFNAAGAPVGGEFRVNTVTTGEEGTPHVAALDGGGFVVSWAVPNFLAFNSQVKAQVYDAAGVAVGGEIVIAVGPDFNPFPDPIVTALPGGDFAIAWKRSFEDVHVQRYAADGTPRGDRFDASTSTLGESYFRGTQAIIATEDGELVVLWSSGSDNFTDILAQRYLFGSLATEQVPFALQNAITVGDDGVGSNVVTVTLSVDYGRITVTTTGSGVAATNNGTASVALTGTVDQLNTLLAGGTASRVSYLAHTDTPPANATLTVAVRDGENQTASSTVPIAILAIDNSIPPPPTYAPVGTDFPINTTQLWEQNNAHVAPLASGGFVAVWQDERSPNLVSQVVARIFDAYGDAVTGELVLGAAKTGVTPQAIGLSSGNFLVTWTTDFFSPPAGFNHGRIYDPSGNPVGAEFEVAASVVSALPGGGFVAAWKDDGTNPILAKVKVQIYDATGAKVGTDLQASAPDAVDSGNVGTTALAGGGFLVSWTGRGSGPPGNEGGAILTQAFDSVGAKVGGIVTVTEDGPAGAVVAGLSSGNYVAAWYGFSSNSSAGLEVLAQIMTPGGTKVGGPIVVNTVHPNGQVHPTITALPDGGFAIAWEDDGTSADGMEFDTKIQVFDATGAKVGPELQMNPAGDNPQQIASIAALARGELVVTWTDFDPAFDFDRGGVRAQMVALVRSGNAADNALTGTAANDALVSLGGNDTLDLSQGGNDSAFGGDDDDMLIFGAAFSGRDRVDGGAGFDTLVLAGDYWADEPGVVLGAPTLKNVERITLAAGWNYKLTMADGNVASGQVLEIDNSAMERLEGLSFNGRAEVDGAFHITGGAGGDFLQGGAGDDELRGEDGNDGLIGGPGNDVLDGGAGYDATDYFDATHGVTVDLSLEVAQDTGWGVDLILGLENLTGSPFDDVLTGSERDEEFEPRSGNNIVHAMGGNDVLDADYGSGLLDGGDGIDWLRYIYNTLPVTVDLTLTGRQTIAPGQTQTIANFEYLTGTIAGNDLLLGDDHDNSLDGMGGNDQLFGRSGGDTIYGGQGTDLLDGGTGADSLQGGADDDRYYVDNAGDMVTEGAAEGSFDRIFASTSYIQGAGVHVEALTIADAAGTATINLTGNELANFIGGNAGANVLDGRGGDDTLVGLGGDDQLIGGIGTDSMIGGLGDDWYYVANAGDVVVEGVAEGVFDRIFASASYTQGAGVHVEALTIADAAGTEAINLTGNELANFIGGNAGANVLDGGGGADTLVGLGGDDWYYVDNAGDVVVEGSGQGSFDRIFASASYTQGTGVLVEALNIADGAGTAAIDLTGNELANFIGGSAGANTLSGGAGDDTLIGLGGDDRMIGGIGADTMVGGTGDDWYYVDHAGDAVTEGAAEGSFDRIFVGASYALGAGVHIEALTIGDAASTTAINLGGNELSNFIGGNAGINVIDGGANADTMIGLAGDDWYYVDNAGDVVIEGATDGAFDRIFARSSYTQGAGVHVEALTIADAAGTAAIDLIGNELDNFIGGNAGANVLDGKAGGDTLVGLGGQDTFAFTTAPGGGAVDVIVDFSVADDTIQLDDAAFTGLATGTLAAGAFVTGSAATDADDRVIYNSATGALLFDADGSGAGAAVQFATLATGLALTSADFLVA